MGQALMGRALMGPLGPLWAGPAPLGLYGPGPHELGHYGPPWALMGQALWAVPLWASLGPCGPGPYEPGHFGSLGHYGPGTCGRALMGLPGPLWARPDFT